MAEMTITVKIEDLPEFKARLARIKKNYAAACLGKRS